MKLHWPIIFGLVLFNLTFQNQAYAGNATASFGIRYSFEKQTGIKWINATEKQQADFIKQFNKQSKDRLKLEARKKRDKNKIMRAKRKAMEAKKKAALDKEKLRLKQEEAEKKYKRTKRKAQSKQMKSAKKAINAMRKAANKK